MRDEDSVSFSRYFEFTRFIILVKYSQNIRMLGCECECEILKSMRIFGPSILYMNNSVISISAYGANISLKNFDFSFFHHMYKSINDDV